VVIARRDLPAARRLRHDDLAVARIPARYAPPGSARVPEEVAGGRLAVPAQRGTAIGPALLAVERAIAVGTGERAVELVGLGSPELIVPGVRVDVLVTPERPDGGVGRTTIALEDVEVLEARRAERGPTGLPAVAATLRVGARQAVRLADELAGAREVRLLPRP
jgi:Flp pilus assembly protein CpaB